MAGNNMTGYLELTKVDNDGSPIGVYFFNAKDSLIIAMQILDEGTFKQRTLLYLQNSQTILQVKESPKELYQNIIREKNSLL